MRRFSRSLQIAMPLKKASSDDFNEDMLVPAKGITDSAHAYLRP
jgi:hypothetical protein